MKETLERLEPIMMEIRQSVRGRSDKKRSEIILEDIIPEPLATKEDLKKFDDRLEESKAFARDVVLLNLFFIHGLGHGQLRTGIQTSSVHVLAFLSCSCAVNVDSVEQSTNLVPILTFQIFALSTVGGDNIGQSARIMMKKIANAGVWSKYSRVGKNGKDAFISLNLNTIIYSKSHS